MNVKAEQQSSVLDTVKLLAALAVVIAGVMAFYQYEQYSLLLRVIGLLVVTAIAIGIALTSSKGRALWNFAGEARTEVRRVVWPTRQETIQTTLMVLFIVLIVGVFLWGVDGLLGLILRKLVGSGG